MGNYLLLRSRVEWVLGSRRALSPGPVLPEIATFQTQSRTAEKQSGEAKPQ